MYLAARDPLHAWALDKRRRIDLEGSGAWIARLGLHREWHQALAK